MEAAEVKQWSSDLIAPQIPHLCGNLNVPFRIAALVSRSNLLSSAFIIPELCEILSWEQTYNWAFV